MFTDPDWIAKQSEARKIVWADPEKRGRVLAGLARAVGGSSLEDALAVILDDMGIKYERQVPIDRCIADFVVCDTQLVIEADGEYWHSRPANRVRDVRRDAWLTSQGYRVLRLPDWVINDDPRQLIRAFLAQ